MNTIIYLHGFNSAGNGNTATLLQSALPRFNLISPTYTVQNPSLALIELKQVLAESLKNCETDDLIAIAGTSMGGFWSGFISSFTGLPAVVINPALHPELQLSRHIGKNKNFATNEEYEFTHENLEGYEQASYLLAKLPVLKAKRIAILGGKDDLIDANVSKVELDSVADEIVWLDNMGHRIEEWAVPTIADAISKTALPIKDLCSFAKNQLSTNLGTFNLKSKNIPVKMKLTQ